MIFVGLNEVHILYHAQRFYVESLLIKLI